MQFTKCCPNPCKFSPSLNVFCNIISWLTRTHHWQRSSWQVYCAAVLMTGDPRLIWPEDFHYHIFLVFCYSFEWTLGCILLLYCCITDNEVKCGDIFRYFGVTCTTRRFHFVHCMHEFSSEIGTAVHPTDNGCLLNWHGVDRSLLPYPHWYCCRERVHVCKLRRWSWPGFCS